MALRISGHLLLGVAKLYLSKAVFLGEEVTEALQQLAQGGEAVEVLSNSAVSTVKVKKVAAQVSSLKEITETTSLKPTNETLPELVAAKEAITMTEHEYTPLSAQIKAGSQIQDHIETSNTFLEDLNDFRIDTIAPLPPQARAETTVTLPVPAPADTGVIMENEEEVNPLLDLDFTIPEAEPPPKKKKKHSKREPKQHHEAPKETEQTAVLEDDEPILPQDSPMREAEEVPEHTATEQPGDPPNEEDDKPKEDLPVNEPEKRGFRKLKKGWVQDTESVLPDYEAVADIDSTSDIVRNPVFLSERSSKTAPDFEKLLYTSNHKLLKLKNALRDAEAPPEPVMPPVPEEEPDVPLLPQKTKEPPAPVVPMEPDEPIVKDEPVPEETPKNNEEEWSERSKRMVQLLTLRLKGVEALPYKELSRGKDAKTTSCGFYELLVLARRDYVELWQPEGLGELLIRPGRKLGRG